VTETDAFLGAAALFAYVLVSARLQARGVNAPMAFTVYGLLLGPLALGMVQLDIRDSTIEGIAIFTLVLTLMTDATRIDVRKLRHRHDMPLRMLGIGLPLTILAGAAVAVWLFPALTLWEAVLLAIILGPTDAALGKQVVQNERVPERVRQALNVESGLNDGLGLPVLLFAAGIASVTDSAGGAGGWAVYLGKQLSLGPLVGLAAGLAGSASVDLARDRGWLNEDHLRLAVFGLALLTYPAAELAGGNGFIATFCCGLVVAMRSPTLQRAAHDFEKSGGELFTLTVFMLFGAVLLPEYLHHIAWRHLLFAGLALTALRMVPVALSLLGLGLMPATLAFVGWFGPRGMASIIYLLIAATRYDVPGIDDIGATVVLTVLVSIFAHGFSAGPLAALYARRAGRRKGAESEPCARFPFP